MKKKTLKILNGIAIAVGILAISVLGYAILKSIFQF